MSGYNSDSNVKLLSEYLTDDPKLKGEVFSKTLHLAATQQNAFSGFTAKYTGGASLLGVRSIFAESSELTGGGADTVNFTVVGTPGGPGANGSQELTGRTSTSLMKTWPVRVGLHRDGFELTKEELNLMTVGGKLKSTLLKLLGKKMGIHRQNDMMMRLRRSVDGNLYRPNNRASDNEILATDTLSLDLCNVARSRLGRIGGMPMQTKRSSTGSPLDGYLVFAGRTAMLPIRNDDGFQIALANGDTRGEANANFTGELIPWQGMPFFEMRETDEAWDDYTGGAMTPTGINNVAFNTGTAAADCKLITNADNTLSLYWQFFYGYGYKFFNDESPSPDGTEYYAWACNPDGSRVFLAYTGSGNNGNQITITKILASAAGVSTKGAKTVGDLTLGTTPTVSSHTLTPDADANVPSGWVYKDEVQAGAYIIQANSRGVCLGESYVFGAMAACFAYGGIRNALIEQERDYGHIQGRGYEEFFGTGVTKNPRGKPVSYLLVRHAIEHEGYPCPSI